MKHSRELVEIMNTVVNVRTYLGRPIPKDVLRDLFLAFSLGPSVANVQPWEILLIQDAQRIKRVSATTLDPFLTEGTLGGQSWIEDAPLVAVVILEMRRALARFGEQGELFAIEDTFAAIQNFRIIASLHDLSTACVREFSEEVLRNHLELPWYVKPIAILTAGYSDEPKDIPPRLAVSQLIHEEVWE